MNLDDRPKNYRRPIGTLFADHQWCGNEEPHLDHRVDGVLCLGIREDS